MPERTPTDLERRLHKALREVVMNDLKNRMHSCSLCHWDTCAYWPEWEPERHASDCLAAPDALTRGDEG